MRLDKSVKKKLASSPLRSLFNILVKMQEVESKESLAKAKAKQYQKAIDNPIPSTASNEVTKQRPSTPLSFQHRFPISRETLDNKRKISDTSFGSRSTETTPTKLRQPEAVVQALQNEFVSTIIEHLWDGDIVVSWAEGRHMFLSYDESHPILCSADCRTSVTSFQYTVLSPDNEQRKGRVKAIADGALVLKTNKISNANKFCIWSKQRCAISFEVCTPFRARILITGKKSRNTMGRIVQYKWERIY